MGDTSKRFFDRADLLKLFAHGWHIVALEEQTIDRYERPKVIWELVALARLGEAVKIPHQLGPMGM